jgi:hypothetical protein
MERHDAWRSKVDLPDSPDVIPAYGPKNSGAAALIEDIPLITADRENP